jgi:hypothetical protein
MRQWLQRLGGVAKSILENGDNNDDGDIGNVSDVNNSDNDIAI